MIVLDVTACLAKMSWNGTNQDKLYKSLILWSILIVSDVLVEALRVKDTANILTYKNFLLLKEENEVGTESQ